MADYRNTTQVANFGGVQTGQSADSGGAFVIVNDVTSDEEPSKGGRHTVQVTASKAFFADPGNATLQMTADGEPVGEVFFYNLTPSNSQTVTTSYTVPNKDSYQISFEGIDASWTFSTSGGSILPGFGGGDDGGSGDGGDGGDSGPVVSIVSVLSDSDPVRNSTHTVSITGQNLFFAGSGTFEDEVLVNGEPAGRITFSQIGSGEKKTVNFEYPVPNTETVTIGFATIDFTKEFETTSPVGGGGDGGTNGSGSPNDGPGQGGSPINGRNAVILGGLAAGAVALSQLGGD
jgi:hypothetical protein